MRTWPAVDLESTADPNLLLAIVDGLDVTAIEEYPNRLRVFFSTGTARDSAIATLRSRDFIATPVEVDDEDWARRSQEGLAPSPSAGSRSFPLSSRIAIPNPQSHVTTIVIRPSIWASAPAITPPRGSASRHCRRWTCEPVRAGRRHRIRRAGDRGCAAGASSALGIDVDADAIQAATRPSAQPRSSRRFLRGCRRPLRVPLPRRHRRCEPTGALLARAAREPPEAGESGGFLIVSGLLSEEREPVLGAPRPPAG